MTPTPNRPLPTSHAILRLAATLLFLTLSLLGHTDRLKAQTFTDLAPQDYPVGETLPLFSTSIALPEGRTADDVEVKVEYPEFTALTAKEKSLLRQHNISLPETLRLETNYVVERKRGRLEVSFAPFLHRDGKDVRLTSIRVSLQPRSTASLAQARISTTPASRYTSKSVLAEGKWLKISVDKEGIYQLTKEKLAELGFADISRVKIYGQGGLIQQEKLSYTSHDAPIDDLREVPALRSADRLLFFAEGTVRWTWSNIKGLFTHQNNPYSTKSCYFLTEGDAPAEIEDLPQQSGGTETTTIGYHTVIDNDYYSWYSGGRQLYDPHDFSEVNTKTYTIDAPGFDPAGDTTVDIAFAASDATMTTQLEVKLADYTLFNTTIRIIRSNESCVDVKLTKKIAADSEAGALLGKQNTFRFTTTARRQARLNYLRLNYQRQLDANQTGYSFVPNASAQRRTLRIENATAHTQLWRLGTGQVNLARVATRLEGTTLYAPLDETARRYVLVNTTADYPTPKAEGQIANQNLHADSLVDMVIVVPTSGQLTEQAERIADLHRQKEGLRVKIVPQNEIFNEFGSGVPDATAIRRYMKMLYDRAQTDEDAPRYLLLCGAGSFDNRMLTEEWKNDSPDDYLLCYEQNDLYDSSTVTSIGDLLSYVTDDYFGYLDDNEGNNIKMEKIDLAIGRIPSSNPEEVRVIVDKIIEYSDNRTVGSWKNRAVMIGDYGDNNSHMQDAERVALKLSEYTQDRLQVKRFYLDAYRLVSSATGNTFPKATTDFQEQMKKGALLFNYSGHGSPDQLSHAKFIFSSDFVPLTGHIYPLWVLASCEILPYDSKESNMATTALFNKNGGAIAFVCSARAVYATQNNALNLAYTKYLLGDGAGTASRQPMGEALRLAKNEVITNSQDTGINKLKYILAGDPALYLALPTGNVVVDSINGQELTADTFLQLPAGSSARFSGHIVTEENTTADDFSGIISAVVSDKKETVKCLNNMTAADKAYTYTERTKTIFEGSDSVRNGRFTMYVPIPRDISYSRENARISLYAFNEAHTFEAHGQNEQFCLDGTFEGAAADTLGPQISMYLNDPSFVDGGVVDDNPVFYAELRDESGINLSGITPGHDLELILDENTSNSLSLNDYFSYNFGSYQEGVVSYGLSNLSAGDHSIRFRVWDINNNVSTSLLRFRVTDELTTDFSIFATKNPARSSTTFIVRTPAGWEDSEVVLEVYNTQGRKLWEQTASTAGESRINIPWNLTDGTGAVLPAGLYLYRASLQGSQGKQTLDAKKIIVLRQ